MPAGEVIDYIKIINEEVEEAEEAKRLAEQEENANSQNNEIYVALNSLPGA